MRISNSGFRMPHRAVPSSALEHVRSGQCVHGRLRHFGSQLNAPAAPLIEMLVKAGGGFEQAAIFICM